MKKILSFLVVLFVSFPLWASDNVSILISDGIDNETIKNKMEQTMSRLFTEANVAHETNRNLNYTGLGLSDEVKTSIGMLWENSPFVCLDNKVVEHCLTTGTGYQIRNIPLELVNADEDDKYHEAVIGFDKRGNMTSFHLAISWNLYKDVISANLEVTDLRRKQLVVDWVEQFRTAYNEKNIRFLDAVFSEDALIITGTVIPQRSKEGIRLPDKIKYNKQTKTQYLTNLRKVFARNKHIRVTFDEIEVEQHPTVDGVYGVTLHQGYSSDSYHDDGYLFLLWDFRKEDKPTIHVRTWQPDKYNDGKKVVKISEDDKIGMGDFGDLELIDE